jgi:Virulence-associated protein E/Poxvirus D5 protein-like
LRGQWIIEIDLDAVRRLRDIRALMLFVARRSDWFGRKEYGRRCAFGATTDRDSWPTSSGGGWWPVRCGRFDLDALERDRDFLWAEALVRYRAHELQDRDFLWAEALVRYRARELQDIDRIEVEDVATILRFLGERCKIHHSETVRKDALYEAYCSWCEARGTVPLNKVWFCRDLRTAMPRLKNYRPGPDERAEDRRVQCYRGLQARVIR